MNNLSRNDSAKGRAAQPHSRDSAFTEEDSRSVAELTEQKFRFMPLLLALAAAGLLAASLKLPLWQMRMESPQYQNEEALRVAVYPGALTGDLNEIRVLNKYIGVHIPETLPQLRWLPVVLLTGAVLGVLAGLAPTALSYLSVGKDAFHRVPLFTLGRTAGEGAEDGNTKDSRFSRHSFRNDQSRSGEVRDAVERVLTTIEKYNAVRAWTLAGVVMAVALTLVASAGLAQWQMHAIGHQRDPKAALKGVKDFTPPLIGKLKVGNFTLHSRLGLGAYAIATALGLQTAAAFAGGGRKRAGECGCAAVPNTQDEGNPMENFRQGSTGYQPVPSGNLSDGTGVASMMDTGAGLPSTSPVIPTGRLPTGAARLPAPPVIQKGSKAHSETSNEVPA